MTRFRKLIELTLCLAMIIAIVAPLRADAAQPAVTLEIESIDKLIADVATVSKTLGQEAMEPAMMRGAVGGMLNVPGLAGIDTSKPVQVHVFLPEVKAGDPGFTPDKLIPFAALVLPLSDNGQAFSSAVKSQFPVTKKTGSVHHFSNPGDGEMIPPQELYLAALGNRVILCKQPGAAEVALASLKASGAPSSAIRFPGTVKAHIDIETAVSFVETAMDQMTAMISEQPVPEEMAMNPAEILDAEAKALIQFMRELRSLTVGIKVSPSSIDFYDRLTPRAGTKTAQWITDLGSPSEQYLSFLPEDALFASVGTGINVIDQIAEPYSELLEKIFGAMGPQFSKLGPVMQEMMVDMKGMYGGDLAMGVIPLKGGSGIGFVEMLAVTDAAKAKEVIDKMYVAFNDSFGESLPGLKMKTEEAREYKGVEIKGYSYDVDAAAQPTNATPLAMPMPEWIDDMKWEMAFSGNNVIYTMGKPEVMNAALDGLGGPGKSIAKSGSFAKLFPQTKGTVVEFHTLSISGLIREVLAMLPDMDQAALATIAKDSEGIAGYTQAAKGNLIGVDRISFSEIKAIMGAVPAIQGAMPAIISSMGIPMPGPGGGMSDEDMFPEDDMLPEPELIEMPVE